jgi:hypothetical protein
MMKRLIGLVTMATVVGVQATHGAPGVFEGLPVMFTADNTTGDIDFLGFRMPARFRVEWWSTFPTSIVYKRHICWSLGGGAM